MEPAGRLQWLLWLSSAVPEGEWGGSCLLWAQVLSTCMPTSRGRTQATRTDLLSMSVLMCPVPSTSALHWCSCSSLVCTGGTYEPFPGILGQWMYGRMDWVILFHHFASFNCTVSTIHTMMALVQFHVCSVACFDVQWCRTAVFYQSSTVLKSWGFGWVSFIELVYILFKFLKKAEKSYYERCESLAKVTGHCA